MHLQDCSARAQCYELISGIVGVWVFTLPVTILVAGGL